MPHRHNLIFYWTLPIVWFLKTRRFGKPAFLPSLGKKKKLTSWTPIGPFSVKWAYCQVSRRHELRDAPQSSWRHSCQLRRRFQLRNTQLLSTVNVCLWRRVHRSVLNQKTSTQIYGLSLWFISQTCVYIYIYHMAAWSDGIQLKYQLKLLCNLSYFDWFFILNRKETSNSNRCIVSK